MRYGQITMRDKEYIRMRIWKLMEEKGIAAFPRPVYHRIPNFKGSREAAEKLASTRIYRTARVVKVNPDAPQRPVRYRVLRDGKLLIMPTPRLRGGFILLDPLKIPGNLLSTASTIKGAFSLGVELSPEKLASVVESIDLIVEGSVAVDLKGGRLGKGEGYGDKEYDILSKAGLVSECTPVATTVHDVQLVENPLPQEPHDAKVSLIATPSGIIVTEYGEEQSKKCDLTLV
jgi:5-formyltetrahydrofolate cyclo-ligase